MVAQWPELRKLTELRSAYQKYSVESKEAAKVMLNATEPDVAEVKSILCTLSSQMLKIRDLNARIQTLVKKDIFQWRNEVSLVVDFNLTWMTHLRDLRRKCEACANVLRERASPLVTSVDEIFKAIEALSEKEMLPRTPSKVDLAENKEIDVEQQLEQENNKTESNEQLVPKKQRKQSDPKKPRKSSEATKKQKQRKQSDSKKLRKQSETKKVRRESGSKKTRKDSEPKKPRKDSESKKPRKVSESKKQRKESEPKKKRKESEQQRESESKNQQRESEPKEHHEESEPINPTVKPATQTDVASTLLERIMPRNTVSRTIFRTKMNHHSRPLSWTSGLEMWRPTVRVRRTSCLKGSGEKYINTDISHVVKGIRDIAERGKERRKMKTVRWSMDLDQVSAA